MKFLGRMNTKENLRRANVTTKRRILFLMTCFGVVTFSLLFMQLWNIQIIDHAMYAEKAIQNQTRDLKVSANRGTINDRNGNILAISASVHNVVISPKDIIEKELDQNLIADGLATILDIDRDSIMERMKKTEAQYQVLAYRVEEEIEKQVRKFVVDNGLSSGVYLEADSKRYYPYASLAAQVVGFVNSENQGAYGLEAIYENNLSGQAGRIVTARAANGVEMLTGYEAYVDAENGNNLNLTIDSTIQYYAQRTVEKGIEEFDVLEGGFCIVMNPKSGEIYAMVSLPDYDLNQPSTVKDVKTKAELAAMQDELFAMQNALSAPQVETSETQEEVIVTEENKTILESEYRRALSNAQMLQWRSKAINDTYEPGSTFKPIVVAMGLEEATISTSDHYYCSGSVMVPGWDKPIRCHKRTGHGDQTLREALMNSCNPAMIEIGQKIGAETFYQYVENYGLLSTTGVDMQGEGRGNFWPKSEFLAGGGNIVSLATASFGQRFQVTPIALISALSATINGGYLYEPYVVQSISDSMGNVIEYNEPTLVRQVISQATSDEVRSMMESVVGDGGTGKNAFIEGYRIGGKTGTSQTNQEGHLIVSFVGFAPADDPEIIVLLAYDHPKQSSPGSTYTDSGHYISGGNMAAPMAGQLIADILDYLGVQKQGEQSLSDVSVPSLRGSSLQKAKDLLAAKNLRWKVVGSGNEVTDQTPQSGMVIPTDSAVVIYMEEEKSDNKTEVPNVLGRTYASAKRELEDNGLYIKAVGSEAATSTNMIAFSQSLTAGVLVEPGTVVEVYFLDNSVQDYAN